MKRRVAKFTLFATLALVAIAVFAFVVMLLWNSVLPPVTGWHTITYWQALGLLILSKILFSGFRGPRGGTSWRLAGRHWQKMTPEEREKFREVIRQRCGWSEPPAAGNP
ncbi:MAG TPA: hypothetical protein VKH35_11320 [Thermoanaerobaculia bacterium]|nr:hypothetical protein [Thermoanaerobaculia bacterium]